MDADDEREANGGRDSGSKRGRPYDAAVPAATPAADKPKADAGGSKVFKRRRTTLPATSATARGDDGRHAAHAAGGSARVHLAGKRDGDGRRSAAGPAASGGATAVAPVAGAGQAAAKAAAGLPPRTDGGGGSGRSGRAAAAGPAAAAGSGNGTNGTAGSSAAREGTVRSGSAARVSDAGAAERRESEAPAPPATRNGSGTGDLGINGAPAAAAAGGSGHGNGSERLRARPRGRMPTSGGGAGGSAAGGGASGAGGSAAAGGTGPVRSFGGGGGAAMQPQQPATWRALGCWHVVQLTSLRKATLPEEMLPPGIKATLKDMTINSAWLEGADQVLAAVAPDAMVNDNYVVPVVVANSSGVDQMDDRPLTGARLHLNKNLLKGTGLEGGEYIHIKWEEAGAGSSRRLRLRLARAPEGATPPPRNRQYAPLKPATGTSVCTWLGDDKTLGRKFRLPYLLARKLLGPRHGETVEETVEFCRLVQIKQEPGSGGNQPPQQQQQQQQSMQVTMFKADVGKKEGTRASIFLRGSERSPQQCQAFNDWVSAALPPEEERKDYGLQFELLPAAAGNTNKAWCLRVTLCPTPQGITTRRINSEGFIDLTDNTDSDKEEEEKQEGGEGSEAAGGGGVQEEEEEPAGDQSHLGHEEIIGAVLAVHAAVAEPGSGGPGTSGGAAVVGAAAGMAAQAPPPQPPPPQGQLRQPEFRQLELKFHRDIAGIARDHVAALKGNRQLLRRLICIDGSSSQLVSDFGLDPNSIVDDLAQYTGILANRGADLPADALPPRVRLRRVWDQSQKCWAEEAEEKIAKGDVIGILPGYVMPAEVANEFVEYGYEDISQELRKQLETRALSMCPVDKHGRPLAEPAILLGHAWRVLATHTLSDHPALDPIEGADTPAAGAAATGAAGVAAVAAAGGAGSGGGWRLSSLGYDGLAALVTDPRVYDSMLRPGSPEWQAADTAAEKGANCAVIYVRIRGLPHPVLVAKRDIEPRERLTTYKEPKWWNDEAMGFALSMRSKYNMTLQGLTCEEGGADA